MSDRYNYYKILGLEPGSPISEIKKKYKLLALKYHPDKTNGEAKKSNKFIKINEAYEFLSNPENKKKYDTPNFGISETKMRDIYSDKFNEMIKKFTKLFEDNMKTLHNFDTSFSTNETRRNKNGNKYVQHQRTVEHLNNNGKKNTIITDIVNNNGNIERTITKIDPDGKKDVKKINSNDVKRITN